MIKLRRFSSIFMDLFFLPFHLFTWWIFMKSFSIVYLSYFCDMIGSSETFRPVLRMDSILCSGLWMYWRRSCSEPSLFFFIHWYILGLRLMTVARCSSS